MDLKKYAAESEPIVLADLSLPFKIFEGQDVRDEERVYVTVRQATQENNIKRSGLLARREVKYNRDQTDTIDSVSEVSDDNVSYRRMLEAWWTLEGVYNLKNGETDWFKPLKKSAQSEFEKAWGALPPVVANAITLAVLKVNPTWDSARQGE